MSEPKYYEMWWCFACGRVDDKDSAVREQCPCGNPWRTLRWIDGKTLKLKLVEPEVRK